MLRHAVALSLCLAAPVFGPDAARASDFWDEVKTPGLRQWRVHRDAARDALAQGRWDAAVAEADLAIERIPDRAEAHVIRGRGLGELSRLPEAAAAFERALTLDERALDAIGDGAHAAQVAASAGAYELAARILPRVLGRMRLNSARHDLYALYGDVLSALGPDRLREAVVAYREAVRQSGRANVRAGLGLALSLRRAGETLEPSDLARAAAARGRVDGIIAGLPLPESERAARRAVALVAIGDIQGARQAWREAASEPMWADHAERELADLGGRRGGTQ